MSQRESGYARKEHDLYETPEWVTAALLSFLPRQVQFWEPASGSGKMARVLSAVGPVTSTDIMLGDDFLRTTELPHSMCAAIVTNPPYERATEFCEHALQLMEPVHGFVAMLLRTDFDHAKSRTHLFRDCPAFARKLVLMKRIAWFVDEDGRPKGSPSFNHAWYIWDWRHEGSPTISYGP